MANEKELKLAKEVYKSLAEMLDEIDWRYGKDEEKFIIYFGVNRNNMDIPFVIFVDPDRQLIRISSRLPFEVDKDLRVTVAVALNYVNYQLADGSFDFNIGDGTISFRMTSSFKESVIGAELFSYMVNCTVETVYRYNDKFLALANNEMDIGQFVDSI